VIVESKHEVIGQTRGLIGIEGEKKTILVTKKESDCIELSWSDIYILKL
jgi:hypothetical protein